MKLILKKIAQFLRGHRRLIVAALCSGLALIVLLAPDIALAAEAKDSDVNELINDVANLFNMLLRLSSAWMWPIILMIGSLLDNDLIFGGAMGERLLSIWVQIRNLVNIVFVLILLAIAVYNVLGLGEEGGGLPLAFKTVMPKFVLALVAVNFSFLACKVVLDFTNVIAGAVFALPHSAIEEEINLDAKVAQVICGSQGKDVPMKPLWCKGGELNERAKSFFARLDRSNITIAYAINFGKAHNLKFIKNGIKDLSQLAFNIVFNAVIYVVYAISFIVLFLVLLTRVVVLWVGVVLSPLMALSIVLPNLKELAGAGGELQTKFVKNATAPIIIGLVLSVGYIMLDGFDADKSLHGEILSSSTLEAIDPNSIPTDITDLQQLMIAVAMVVILWVGVFEGAKGTAAEGITNIIKSKGEQFGGWVAKLPMYAQVLPTEPGVPGKSIAQVFDKVGKIGKGWTDKRRYWEGEAPAGSNDLDKAIQERNPEGIGTVLRNNKHLFRSGEQHRKLQKFAEANDQVLHEAIKGVKEGDMEGFIKGLYSAKGKGSKTAEAMIRKIGVDSSDELIAQVKVAPEPSVGGAGPKPAAGGGAGAGGPTVTSPAGAAKALEKSKTDTDPEGAKPGKGAFIEYNQEELKRLRESFEKFSKQVAPTLAQAALPWDSGQTKMGKTKTEPEAHFNAVLQLYNGLKGSSDSAGLKTAVEAAKSAQVTQDVIERVIDAMPTAELSDQLKAEAKNHAKAAS